MRLCAGQAAVSSSGSAVVGAETQGGRGGGRARQGDRAPPVRYAAGSFVLATGGFASGGIELDSHGLVTETVLGLPVANVPDEGRPRFSPTYFDTSRSPRPDWQSTSSCARRRRGQPGLREPSRGRGDPRRRRAVAREVRATASASPRATRPPTRSSMRSAAPTAGERRDRPSSRLPRPLRQVHDLRELLPVLARDAALPGPEVRRAAGGAVPRRRRAGGRLPSTTAPAAGSARRSARKA